MHAFKRCLNAFGNRPFDWDRNGDLRVGAGQVVKLVEIARIAFCQIVEEQRDFVEARLQR